MSLAALADEFLAGGAPSGRKGWPVRITERLSSNLSGPGSALMVYSPPEPTLNCPQQRWYMARDDLQGVVERLAQSPGEHQIEHLVHLPSEHGSHRRRQHRETLEYWRLERGVLFPAAASATLPRRAAQLDHLDNVVDEWPHL
jgi:hypothetical protein